MVSEIKIMKTIIFLNIIIKIIKNIFGPIWMKKNPHIKEIKITLDIIRGKCKQIMLLLWMMF